MREKRRRRKKKVRAIWDETVSPPIPVDRLGNKGQDLAGVPGGKNVLDEVADNQTSCRDKDGEPGSDENQIRSPLSLDSRVCSWVVKA